MLSVFFLMTSNFFNLPSNLLSSLCWVESSHRPHVVHVKDGNTDDYGICQIKLETAKLMGFKGSAKDLLNPQINIYFAGKLLAHHLKECYSEEEAILAYSSGRCGIGNKNYLQKIKIRQKQENRTL